jgi:hypothetical protein
MPSSRLAKAAAAPQHPPGVPLQATTKPGYGSSNRPGGAWCRHLPVFGSHRAPRGSEQWPLDQAQLAVKPSPSLKTSLPHTGLAPAGQAVGAARVGGQSRLGIFRLQWPMRDGHKLPPTSYRSSPHANPAQRVQKLWLDHRSLRIAQRKSANASASAPLRKPCINRAHQAQAHVLGLRCKAAVLSALVPAGLSAQSRCARMMTGSIPSRRSF